MKNILLISILISLISLSVSGNSFTEFPSPGDSTKKEKKRYRTSHSFNLDLGINNYHKDGNFPDENNEAHSVRPWGSWYVGLTSLQRSHLAGGLFVEWGGGLSWYNFKFQDDNTILTEGPEQVEFTTDDVNDFNYEKSKLTVSYVNLTLVPVYQFGQKKYKNSGSHWKKNYKDLGLRIGAGGYVGYRLGSHTKLKYEDEGNRTQKDKDSDNFYLENLRYGLRAQIGYKGTDLFLNYDLNNLFNEGRGPDLSAVSFGFMF